MQAEVDQKHFSADKTVLNLLGLFINFFIVRKLNAFI